MSNTRARTGKMLRELVEASPHDDAPRLVYADHLLEKQDPRGEFIALSFEEGRRELDAKEKKKLASILKVHERSWLGPIVDVTAYRAYRHGFLDDAVMEQGTEPAVLEAARGHHAWSTVRTLGCSYETFASDLAMDPCMRALQKVTAISATEILRLARHTAPLGIEQIDLIWLPDHIIELANQVEVLATAPGLQRLTRLRMQSVFTPHHIEWLSGTLLAQKLTVIDIGGQWPKALDAWVTGLRPMRISAAFDLGFGVLSHGADGQHSVLRLQIARLPPHGIGGVTELIEAMGRLAPDALTELEIHGAAPATWVTFRALAARQRRLLQPALIGGERL